jgi:hypothetical protein
MDYIAVCGQLIGKLVNTSNFYKGQFVVPSIQLARE